MKRLMVLGLVTSLFFTGLSVCNIDPVYASKKIDKKDRKYTEKEIDSTVKERANQLIEALDGRCFTSDGYRAYGSGASDCNVLKVLNHSERVRKLNKKNKGGYRPPSKTCLPYFYGQTSQFMPPAYSCAGFAMYAQWYLFANWYNDDVEVYPVVKNYKFTYKNLKKYGRVGDIIWTYGGFSSGHASVILDITKEGVKVLDSNTAMYSLEDLSDNRVCVYVLEYEDQYGVTISRPKNYYVHYSDGLKDTSYEKDARTIHEQVVAPGDSFRVQKTKFKRDGYTYDKYYIAKVVDGKLRYLCRNEKTGEKKWLASDKITKSYKKSTIKAGGKLTLNSSRVKRAGEIQLLPVWKKVK